MLRRAASADEEAVRALGELVDLAGDLSRRWGLELTISQGTQLLAESDDPLVTGTLHYFLANAWASMRKLTRSDRGDPLVSWTDRTGVEEIAHLRASNEALDGLAGVAALRRQVLTNLGNALDARGRLVEALEAWDEALRIDPRFGMALGNWGIGLEWYTSLIHDPGHRLHFIREAHRCLVAAERSDTAYPDAIAVFAGARQRIEARVPRPALTTPSHPWTPTRTWSTAEQAYRTWSAHQRLFLNVLNDISTEPIAMADVLVLPDLVTSLEDGPTLLGFFNQIKQEFVASRLLLYRGMHSSEVHFADRDVTLVNTLDYPVYSIAAEEVKLAYRALYSIFDKLAFFLNDYLALGIPERGVNFKTLWYEHREPRHGPRLDLVRRGNAPLRALFWLSQDLFAPGERSSDLAAEKMAEIRQELEHKYLKLHEHDRRTPGRVPRSGDIAHDRLAYSLSITEFTRRALRLARLVRAALIYLVFSVHVEERERALNRPSGTVTAPMMPSLWDDEWKY